jgi:hypothetical protein
MSSQVAGATIANIWEIESATKAGRVTLRDIDYGTLGIYSFGAANGGTVMTAGLTANAPVFSFRWTQAVNLCLVRRFRLSMAAVTAFTAGGAIFNLFAARSFTVVDSGGTSVLPTGNQNKLRTSGMGTTLVGDARISATVALTPGTRTLDSNPLASIVGGCPNVAGQQIILPGTAMLDFRPGEHPLILAQNEGLVLQANVPATGTWFWSVILDIAELAAY